MTCNRFFLAFLLAGVSIAAPVDDEVSKSYVISTIAGNGRARFTGNGGLAVNAHLVQPQFTAVDAGGNIYVSDSYFNQVFRIDVNGGISIYAGSGQPGYSGDGGPAKSAALNQPAGLVFDAAGDLYIADTNNWCVRKVNSQGVISTAVSVEGPQGLAIDSVGNLYITQPANNVIRKVTPGGVMSAIAGTGQAGYSGDGRPATAALLSGPSGITVDSKGIIYFSDQSSRIRRIGTDGTITTYSGNASLSYPTGLVATPDGILYVADSGNFRVVVITPSGVINTIAGGGSLATDGPATQAILPYPVGLAADSLGRIVIAINAGRQVRRWAADGTITTVAGVYPSGGSADHVPATSQTLLQVYGIAVDTLGDVFVSDSTDNRIYKIAPDDTMSTFAGDSQSGSPADGSKASILGAPWGLAVDANGNLLVGAGTYETVFRLTPGGISTRVAGGNGAADTGDFGNALEAAIGNPMSVAAAGDGGFYISDPVFNVIRKVTAQGEILTYAGTAKLNNPQQIAVDSDGSLYIADSGNNVVRKVSPAGVITTVAGNGQVGGNLGDGGQATAAELVAPRGVVIDREMAALFISEGNRIRRVDLSTGVIHTIAGGIQGTYGFAGDGGPAFAALLANPGHLAVDSNHNVYFCDNGNLRVRKLTLVREDKKRAGPQPE